MATKHLGMNPLQEWRWARAVRMAAVAEEIVLSAHAAYLEGKGPPPTAEMRHKAVECRAEADRLFRALPPLPEDEASES